MTATTQLSDYNDAAQNHEVDLLAILAILERDPIFNSEKTATTTKGRNLRIFLDMLQQGTDLSKVLAAVNDDNSIRTILETIVAHNIIPPGEHAQLVALLHLANYSAAPQGQLAVINLKVNGQSSLVRTLVMSILAMTGIGVGYGTYYPTSTKEIEVEKANLQAKADKVQSDAFIRSCLSIENWKDSLRSHSSLLSVSDKDNYKIAMRSQERYRRCHADVERRLMNASPLAPEEISAFKKFAKSAQDQSFDMLSPLLRRFLRREDVPTNHKEDLIANLQHIFASIDIPQVVRDFSQLNASQRTELLSNVPAGTFSANFFTKLNKELPLPHSPVEKPLPGYHKAVENLDILPPDILEQRFYPVIDSQILLVKHDLLRSEVISE